MKNFKIFGTFESYSGWEKNPGKKVCETVLQADGQWFNTQQG
jgi:hypothetical protein